MNKFKRFSWVGVIFLAVFLCVSLPQAQSAEATIPLTATALTGAAEADPRYHPYTLTFKLAAVALHREDNKSESWGLIDADDLDLGWAPGMDASIMLHNPCYGVELRYLGLHQWSESKSAYYSSAVAQYDIFESAKFRSRLHNVELNLHWWPCTNDRYSLLAGFRWLRLTDTLSLFQSITGGEVPFEGGETISSRNQFWGGQVGAEGLLYGERDQGFSIDGVVKVGLFANDINNHVRGYSIPGGSGSFRWDRTKTSFIGEVGLNANYAFTKNIAMTLGYEFLYLNKVAVPVNECSTQSVIYNGARLGLNFVF
jgi:Protein of unknown function (DUF1551).